MVRRFFTNLLVNLAGGFLLFFFSERLFWTVFKPGDKVFDLLITWLAYSVLVCVFLNVIQRCEARTFPRIALAGAIFGWLAEGALVGTLYGTESSAPFPISIIQTALSWHMLISVIVGFGLLTGAVRQGSIARTALVSVAIGLFWAAWAPFQWRETPPVIVPISSFATHAFVIGVLLVLTCGFLSGPTVSQSKPGWFGLILSLLILAVFYSEQVKALGVRPLIVLPLLVGGVLALLYWTKGENSVPVISASDSKRWSAAAFILLMPVTAMLGYAIQRNLKVGGLNPGWIFHGLAVTGSLTFVVACILVLRSRLPSRNLAAPRIS
jgi:hypothetical protein